MYDKDMELSDYNNKVGVAYKTVYYWFKTVKQRSYPLKSGWQ